MEGVVVGGWKAGVRIVLYKINNDKNNRWLWRCVGRVHASSSSGSSSELEGSGSSSKVGAVLWNRCEWGDLKASVVLRNAVRAAIPSSVLRIVGRKMSLEI